LCVWPYSMIFSLVSQYVIPSLPWHMIFIYKEHLTLIHREVWIIHIFDFVTDCFIYRDCCMFSIEDLQNSNKLHEINLQLTKLLALMSKTRCLTRCRKGHYRTTLNFILNNGKHTECTSCNWFYTARHIIWCRNLRNMFILFTQKMINLHISRWCHIVFLQIYVYMCYWFITRVLYNYLHLLRLI
jgi:hypothetical protein